MFHHLTESSYPLKSSTAVFLITYQSAILAFPNYTAKNKPKKKKHPSSFQDKSEIRKILWLLNFLCLYMCDYPNIFMIAPVCQSDNFNHSPHAEGLQCHYMSITETKKQLREEITTRA